MKNINIKKKIILVIFIVAILFSSLFIIFNNNPYDSMSEHCYGNKLSLLKFKIGAFFSMMQNTRRNTVSYDTLRGADLMGVSNALEFIFEQNGAYPNVTASTPKERWNQLMDVFKENNLRRIDDPCVKNAHGKIRPEFYYDYVVSPTKDAYVLRAMFYQEHYALDNDEDGNILGINCDDPVYCFKY